MAQVVIADDSPVFRSALRKVLEEGGHTVMGEASNAEETFSMLGNNMPDLLMLDLLMPGKSGLDVLKGVSRKYPKLKVLLVTAVNQKMVNDEAKKLGAKGVLYKPFDSDEMLKLVDRVIGG